MDNLIPGYALSIGASVLWLVSCIGIGSFITGRSKQDPPLESLVMSFLTGVIAWLMVSLVLTFFAAFRPAVIRVLVYSVGLFSLAAFGRRWASGAIRGGLLRLESIILGVIFIGQLLYSLMPVISFDALCYHLPLAKDMLAQGTIVWTPFVFNASFPKNYEILQAIGLALGGDVSATMMSLWCSLATVLAIVCIGNRIGRPLVGLWSAIALGLTPLWFQLSHEPMNEVGIAFGLSMLMLAVVKKAPGWQMGLILGWLCGIKYYGMEVSILGLLIWSLQTKPGSRHILIAAGLAFLIAGYWYLRNIYLFSNPIYPYYENLFRVFGSPHAQGADIGNWDAYSQFDQFASPKTLLEWLTVPYRLMFSREPRFTENGYVAWQWVGLLSYAWPFAIFAIRKRARELTGIYIFVLVMALVWAFVHGIIYLRFLTPLLGLMYFLSLFTLASWLSFLRISAKTGRFLTVAACLLALIHLGGPTTSNIRLVFLPLTSEERELFLEDNIIGWPVIRELNQTDPKPVVYNLYGEDTRYYCDFTLYAGWRDPYGYTVFEEHADTGKELADWLESIDVDVLLVSYRHGREIPEKIVRALSSDEFGSVYQPEVLSYKQVSAYVRRDVDIHFYLDEERE